MGTRAPETARAQELVIREPDVKLSGFVSAVNLASFKRTFSLTINEGKLSCINVIGCW